MEKLTLMVVLSLLFNFSVYGRENDNYCREFTTLDTNEKVQALVDKILDKQIVKHHSNRHVLNKKLTDCTASQDSKIVIIAFEGTGAYEPHIPPLMNTLLQCAEGKMTKGMADDLYWKITKSIKGIFSK